MNNSLQAVSSGQGKDVILLHGLFGQGSNLRGIARALELRLGAVHLARGDEEESRRRSGCVVECGGMGETAEEIRARAFETSRHPTRV